MKRSVLPEYALSLNDNMTIWQPCLLATYGPILLFCFGTEETLEVRGLLNFSKSRGYFYGLGGLFHFLLLSHTLKIFGPSICSFACTFKIQDVCTGSCPKCTARCLKWVWWLRDAPGAPGAPGYSAQPLWLTTCTTRARHTDAGHCRRLAAQPAHRHPQNIMKIKST